MDVYRCYKYPIICFLIGFLICYILITKIHLLPSRTKENFRNDYSQTYSPVNTRINNSWISVYKADELLLRKTVRVLVWVMTQPENLQSKAIHVKRTWGKRASEVLFASDTYDPEFPTLQINVSHGRQHLAEKTITVFDHIYQQYLNDFDWFMKADDDTYVIMENLRLFLRDKAAYEPVFYGHLFKGYMDQGFHSGGAGYVLSREALRRLGNRTDRSCEQKYKEAEDLTISFCMQSLGVKAINGIDHLGRSLFHCFNPETQRKFNFPSWYLKRAIKAEKDMAEYPISFHYCTLEDIYGLEHYLYNNSIHG